MADKSAAATTTTTSPSTSPSMELVLVPVANPPPRKASREGGEGGEEEEKEGEGEGEWTGEIEEFGCPMCGFRITDGVGECPQCGTEITETHTSLLGGAYSLRKPRDLFAGTISGVKNAGKGVLLGAATLIAAPIIGAKENGVKGFAMGMVAGLVGAVSLSVVGVVSGTVQVARGLVNTPRSIISRSRNMVWDDSSRSWRHVEPYFLQKEVDEVNASPPPEFVKAKAKVMTKVGEDGAKKVANTEFYDLLGVTPEATPSEIKKAYYLNAKTLHPDRNQGDPQATEKFQKLGKAYEVLSDPDKRAQYDESGSCDTSDSSTADYAALFTALFGSAAFEDLVGELALSSVIAMGSLPPQAVVRTLQHRRSVFCAQKLSAILKPVTMEEEDLDAFKARMTPYVQHLSEVSFGKPILAVLAYVYTVKARQYRSKHGSFFDMSGRVSSLKDSAHNFSTRVAFLRSTLRTYKAYSSSQRKMKAVAENLLETVWQASMQDIESVSRKVCDKVLNDESVDKPARLRRAAALSEFGKMCLEVADPDDRSEFQQLMQMFGDLEEGEVSEAVQGEENEETAGEPKKERPDETDA